MNKCIVIYSGGLQSTVALYWAKQRFDEVHALTFEYGQSHKSEVTAAQLGAKLANVHSHKIVYIPNVLVGDSPVISKNNLALYNDFNDLVKRRSVEDNPESAYVPLLSTLFITLAANRASEKGIDTLVLGSCISDYKNHPESTNLEYYQNLTKVINACIPGEIRIDVPFISMGKSMIISLARDIPGCFNALAYTQTGYDGAYPPIGYDLATIERAGVFESVAVPDPLVIRAWKERRMDLPRGRNYDRFRSGELFPYETDLLKFLDVKRV